MNKKANPKQIDDKDRSALEHFFEKRDEKLVEFLQLLINQGEFWKARVLLELVWEHEGLEGSGE